MNGDGELKTWVKSVDDRFERLETKVDKIAWRVSMMVGGIAVLAFFANKILP